MVPGIAFSQGCREGISGLVVIAITHYYQLNIINCYGYSLLMLQERLKMLVFDRPSFSPLPWYFCISVHIYSLPFSFGTCIHMLSSLGVSFASILDTHPLTFLSLLFYTRLLQLDVGVPELEYPDGAYYVVEIPDGQE